VNTTKPCHRTDNLLVPDHRAVHRTSSSIFVVRRRRNNSVFLTTYSHQHRRRRYRTHSLSQRHTLLSCMMYLQTKIFEILKIF